MEMWRTLTKDLLDKADNVPALKIMYDLVFAAFRHWGRTKKKQRQALYVHGDFGLWPGIFICQGSLRKRGNGPNPVYALRTLSGYGRLAGLLERLPSAHASHPCHRPLPDDAGKVSHEGLSPGVPSPS